MINQHENNRTIEPNYSYVEMPSGDRLMSESLVQIIWRSRWIVLLATVAALAAAFVYITKATPIYTSTSRIYVEQSGPKILTEAEGVMTQSKNYLYTQAELLRSNPILSSALETAGIRRMKIFYSVDNPIAYRKLRPYNADNRPFLPRKSHCLLLSIIVYHLQTQSTAHSRLSRLLFCAFLSESS